MCCVRTVRKVGYFGPMVPDRQSDTVATVIHRTTWILTQSKTQIMTYNKIRFALQMPDFCPNLLFVRCGRWWVVFRVVSGRATHYWALRPRCVCAVEKRPLGRARVLQACWPRPAPRRMVTSRKP